MNNIKEILAKLVPSFKIEELDKLSYNDMIEVLNSIKAYIMQTDTAMRSEPFENHDIEDLKDEWINIPLERAIDDCSSLGITPWDGFGEWHLYDKEKDLHYFAPENFECTDLRINESEFFSWDVPEEEIKKKLAEKWRKHFNHNGLEVVGIMWYNK